MTTHLSPDECLSALDHTLADGRRAHLDSCERCRAQVADMNGLWAALQEAADVPEPSPLFWDHLSDRVGTAVRTEIASPAPPWWQVAWRPLLAAGAAGSALTVFLMLHAPIDSHLMPRAGAGSAAPGGSAAAAAPDPSWNVAVQMSQQLSSDEIDRIAMASGDSVVLGDDLTPRERGALIQLLRDEMGGGR